MATASPEQGSPASASASASFSAPGSGLSRRVVSSTTSHNPPINRPPIHPDVDPPPRPRPGFQFLAFALVVFLASLQFLPATHFRDPSDPHRTWIPFDPNRTASAVSSLSPSFSLAIYSIRVCLMWMMFSNYYMN